MGVLINQRSLNGQLMRIALSSGGCSSPMGPIRERGRRRGSPCLEPGPALDLLLDSTEREGGRVGSRREEGGRAEAGLAVGCLPALAVVGRAVLGLWAVDVGGRADLGRNAIVSSAGSALDALDALDEPQPTTKR